MSYNYTGISIVTCTECAKRKSQIHMALLITYNLTTKVAMLHVNTNNNSNLSISQSGLAQLIAASNILVLHAS